jgi:hypothetical protein
MEKICLELPIISVDRSQNWGNEEYAKEHEYPTDKPFIADDGVSYWICVFDGKWVNQLPMPKDIFETRLSKMAEDDILGQTKDIISQLCNGLEYIQRLTKECKDEVVTRTTVIEDKIDDLGRCGGGDGVNVLDLAKSFAVIQKPELIKELK